MKYKVTEYHSDFQEEQTGTCELCFGTAWVENGSITVEDENGTETEIYLTVWDWGDYDTIYIDNVVNFSAWLQEREVDPISEETELWPWLNKLVEKYNEELEDAFEYVWEVATGELREWFRKLENRNNFARAWLDGYEVEKEKRYLVKVKGNIKENILVYGKFLERYYFTKSFSLDNAIYSHTRKQLEEAGFGWVFDCPGIEIEEVE